MALPTHLVLVVDISGSMRKCDVRCDASDDEDDEDEDYFSGGPSSSFQSRADAVFDCCADMVRQQLREGATGRDRCTMVLFNDKARTVVPDTRLDVGLLSDIEQWKGMTRPRDRTEYRVGLAEARKRCVSRTPKAHTVVFLSDGAPGDVHFNNANEGLLYDLLDSFSLSCAPGTFTLHTIGLGPDGSEFIWLRKMAAAVGGVYHQPKQNGGQLSTASLRATFRDISSSVTKLRSSSNLSGLTSTMAVVSLKPDHDEDGGPPCTEVLLGDLLTWDAVTRQHEVAMRGVQLELHHPHFAKGGSRLAYRARWLTPLPRLAPAGSRPSGVDIAPAGPEPQTCLMKPGQVVIAKEHRQRKDQHVYDAKCLETAKACAASFPGPPVTFIDCQLFRCMENGQLRLSATGAGCTAAGSTWCATSRVWAAAGQMPRSTPELVCMARLIWAARASPSSSSRTAATKPAATCACPALGQWRIEKGLCQAMVAHHYGHEGPHVPTGSKGRCCSVTGALLPGSICPGRLTNRRSICWLGT
ncbi:uncharacterized protein HaLaN_13177, partial [Haematococcus lacustris]